MFPTFMSATLCNDRDFLAIRNVCQCFDGGLWKSQAVDKVKNYLVKALADVPDREKITIIA